MTGRFRWTHRPGRFMLSSSLAVPKNSTFFRPNQTLLTLNSIGFWKARFKFYPNPYISNLNLHLVVRVIMIEISLSPM